MANNNPILKYTQTAADATGSQYASDQGEALRNAMLNIKDYPPEELEEMAGLINKMKVESDGKGQKLTYMDIKNHFDPQLKDNPDSKAALDNFFTAMAAIPTVTPPSNQQQRPPIPVTTPPVSSVPNWPDLKDDVGTGNRSINLSFVKGEDGKSHLQAKSYDTDGNNLEDKSVTDNLPDGVDENKITKMVNGLDKANRLALITALRSDDHDRAQAAINALASGDKDKLDKAITPPQPAPGGTTEPQLSKKEQMLQDIIDTGVAPERDIRAKLELGSDNYIKQYHDTIMSMANNRTISGPNAKTEALAAAENAAATVDANRSSVVHPTPQYNDLKEIAGLMGKPDLAPDGPSSNLSDFNYNMGRLSERSLSAFRDSLKKTADANHGTIPPGDMKKAIDDAKDAAIKAGEDQAKNHSGFDYLQPGQTKEFLDKAFDKDNNPCAGITPDAPSGAPTDLTGGLRDGSGPSPSAPGTSPRPANGKPPVWHETVTGAINPNGHHYSFKSDPDKGTVFAETNSGLGKGFNEDALVTRTHNKHAADGVAEQLNGAENEWLQAHPGQPQQTGLPSGTAVPAPPGQQQVPVPNSYVAYPPGFVTIGYGPGGNYSYLKGQPGYTIPGYEATRVSGYDATHIPGYEGAYVPGTDAYRNPAQQGVPPQSPYPFNQYHAQYPTPPAGGGRWGHGGPSFGGSHGGR